MKIALVGTYPPPYGGRSIHIQRLKKRLEEDGVACSIYEDSGVLKKENNVIIMKSVSAWLIGQFLYGTEDVIHCHNYSPKLLILFSLLSILKGKRVIFTLHSFRYSPKDFDLWYKFAFWLATRGKVYFITVGPEIKENIVSLGVKPEYVEVIPSFVSPAIREEEIAEIPQEVWSFMASHSPVISANAFKIVFYNNQDLYGIDMCIDLCANLKKDYPQVGLVFSLPDIGNYEYFEKMKQRIVKKGIENNFLFQTKPCQFYPILMKSNVFVRPTNTDGYGVSIVEAICFDVPAIASDVCPRSEGTILFKSRDADDFTLKVKDVLNNYVQHKKKIANIELENNIEKIVKIYKSLMNEKTRGVKVD